MNKKQPQWEKKLDETFVYQVPEEVKAFISRLLQQQREADARVAEEIINKVSNASGGIFQGEGIARMIPEAIRNNDIDYDE